MDVQIVVFPETKVAAIEHFGSPALEHDTVQKLIAWKIDQRLLDPLRYRSYGVHIQTLARRRPQIITSIFVSPSSTKLSPILLASLTR